MAVKAVATGISISPRKVGMVVSLVRGRSVADAEVILEHTPKRAALPVLKAIKSAKANAVNNHGLDGKQLQIVTIDAGSGRVLKRFRPAAHGRALPYRKTSTNLRVVVDGPKLEAPKKSEKSDKSDKSAKTKSSAKEEK